MNDFSHKYKLLDPAGQQRVDKYIESLLQKGNDDEVESFNALYKERILSVSVWSSSDITLLEGNAHLKNWPTQEW